MNVGETFINLIGNQISEVFIKGVIHWVKTLEMRLLSQGQFHYYQRN
jgi:hypothetical protein